MTDDQFSFDKPGWTYEGPNGDGVYWFYGIMSEDQVLNGLFVIAATFDYAVGDYYLYATQEDGSHFFSAYLDSSRWKGQWLKINPPELP